MEATVLSDRNQYPSDDIIKSNLGRTAKLWDEFLTHLRDHHPSVVREWKYYNDGKAWLMKVVGKGKVICWVSLIDKAFRTTFYLPCRAEQEILESNLSDALKDRYSAAKVFNKTRGLVVPVRSRKDLESVKALLLLKEKIR